MNITIDTTIVIAVITNEQKKYRLLELTQGKNLVAPSILSNEVLQTLLHMKKRQWIRESQLMEALEIFDKIAVRIVDIPLHEAARLAQERQITANDAMYLLVVQKYKAPLLTLDHNLKIAANKIGLPLLEDS